MENRYRTKKYTAGGVAFPRQIFTPVDFAIFDQANDAIFLHDAESGALLNLNKKACELYGYSPEEARTLKFSALHPGEYPYTEEEGLRLIRKAAGGEPQTVEWKTGTKTGREIWTEVNLKLVTINDHEMVLAIVRDITRRKRTEQRMQIQHTYLSLLQETTLSIMNLNKLEAGDLLTNLVSHASTLLGTNHGFLYLADSENAFLELKVSTSLQDTFLSPKIRPGENLAGKVWESGEPLAIANYATWSERPPTTPEYIRAMIGAPLKTGAKVFGVIGLCYIDEEYQFREDEIALFGRFAELASIALDNARLYTTARTELSERKQDDSALRTSEERHRLLFNSVNDAMYLTEIAEEGLPEKIVEVNDAACRLLGYSREEFLQLTSADIVPLEYRGDAQEKAAILDYEKHVFSESVYLTKSGTSIPVEVNSHLLPLENRPCVLSMVRDITERKRVEKEVARIDRLNLIGAMAAGIGHEIRNPLTTVRGFLQMLTSKEECLPHKEYFELMVHELDRANSIISEFLSLAKNKAVDLRSGSLNTVVNMILPLLEAGAILYDKSVRMDLGEIPDIQLDEKEIRQLVLNLVRNGLDAMPPGGVLTVRTHATDSDVILSVQDQGKGIAPDVAEKIGTPFFTTKEYGVGLGLAVCYSIASRHNATIIFDSGPTGTTFSVHFRRVH
ncbi:MAG: PAS domain S-box protein [Negativicutes bacterium]|nr:PAS domain S-box protein [Negativicutes bacterium]